MQNSKEKSEELKELFYDYANNLANSCIDQDSLKRSLKEEKYKKRKQYYEVYNVKLDKDSLIKKIYVKR